MIVQVQGTSKFGFTSKSSMPFKIHEDNSNSLKKVSAKLPEKNVENQKPLLLKNEEKINESKVLICKFFYIFHNCV